MDSSIREKLQKKLSDYISQTLKYTETVKEFCDGESKWTLQRETELDTMSNIKGRAGSRAQELVNELEEVLKSTLEGLEKLQHFLDAVEKLTVTSLFVFMGESFMPKGVSSISLRSVISTARLVSPLLIHFKRDAEAFFLPSLHNVEVLTFQLDKYIRVTQQICEKMEKGSRSVSGSGVRNCIDGKSSWEFNLNMSDEDLLQKMYDHLLQLSEIRMDESFRMTFLFGEKAQDFILIFSERHSRMVEFLSGVDAAADQLDKMKKGSNISTVVGSSVGIAGGVLSIVGLALAPITAGISLALTATGIGLGVTSSVNSLVTGITELAVNNHHGKTANSIFSKFMEDVQEILDCMEEVGNQAVCFGGENNNADVDGASGVEDVLSKAVNTELQGAKAGRSIPKLAADLPDIGQLAKGTSFALSKSARVGLIAVNALFIGLDVYFICKDSISLAKGSQNEVAQLFRSRSVLWRSEVEAWEKIHDHLFKGISGFYRKWEILEQPLVKNKIDQNTDLQ